MTEPLICGAEMIRLGSVKVNPAIPAEQMVAAVSIHAMNFELASMPQVDGGSRPYVARMRLMVLNDMFSTKVTLNRLRGHNFLHAMFHELMHAAVAWPDMILAGTHALGTRWRDEQREGDRVSPFIKHHAELDRPGYPGECVILQAMPSQPGHLITSGARLLIVQRIYS